MAAGDSLFWESRPAEKAGAIPARASRPGGIISRSLCRSRFHHKTAGPEIRESGLPGQPQKSEPSYHGFLLKKTGEALPVPNEELPKYHPFTVLRDWNALSKGAAFRISDAQTGVISFGATGSGKTSGPAKYFGHAYLAHGFGGVVLCSKKDERPMWEQWAANTGRTKDLIIIDKSGKWRFNFLEWEASRAGEGAGLTINIVALLDEIAGAIASGAGKADGGSGGDNKFFEDALHHLNTNLVDLALFGSYGDPQGGSVSLPLMRLILNTAPQSLKEAESAEWKDRDWGCPAIVKAADEATKNADEDTRADFEECRNYWMQEFPNLSDRTRSIITLSFSMLVRPFITRPLRRLFSTETNVTPEDTFNGKIIIVDLPVQEFFLAGRVANLAWKYCFQRAVLSRPQPTDGSYLRPIFLWADEAQMFVSEFDAAYQAVARSAGGCTVYLVQNRESLLRVLHSPSAVDSLLGNLQCKCFCQNSSIETNDWAAKLLGERYRDIISTSGTVSSLPGQDGGQSSGASTSEQRRYFVEPARFTTLKRGGPVHDYQVECIVYNGGMKFDGRDEQATPEKQPYTQISFDQLTKEQRGTLRQL
jgi:hypothetical protein